MTALGMLKHDIGVVVIDRRSFVSGLFWQPLKSSRSLRKDAASFAKAHAFDLVTYRTTRVAVQAGFAPAGVRKLRGAYSLVSVLADVLGDSWIAVFQVSDGRYAMGAALGGSIMAGADIVGTEEQVRRAFNELSSVALGAGQQWDRVIAPASWGLKSEEVGLTQLVGREALKKGQRLRYVAIKLSKTQMASAAVLFGLLVGAGVSTKAYLKRQDEEERLALIAAAQERVKAEREVELNKRLAAGPWSQLPPAKTVLEACAKGWTVVPLNVEGWLFDNGRCSTNSLTAVFRRSGLATVESFALAVAADFGKPIIRENGEIAAISFNSDMPMIDEGELPPISEQAQALLSHVQSFGLELELSEMKKGALSEALEGEPEPVALWKSHDFTLKTSFPPNNLFQGFDRVGVRINQIDLALAHETAELNWTVTGSIYGR